MATVVNTVKYLDRSEPLCKLAYHSIKGLKPLEGLYVPGLLGSMSGSKAIIAEELFHAAGCGFTRFDYTGINESGGKEPVKYQFQQWKNDLYSILDKVVGDSVILVGSSMGGWMSVMASIDFPSKVKGLFLISPALDFTDKTLKEQSSEDQKRLKNGEVVEKNDEFGHITVDMSWFEEGRANTVFAKYADSLPIQCPVRIFHGMADTVVPFDHSLELAKRLNNSRRVDVILPRNCDHRVSDADDLRSFGSLVADFIQEVLRDLNVKPLTI